MFGGAALTPALPPFPDLRHDHCGHWGCSPPTSMGSWCPSRVCSEPFAAGLPQWKWSCSAVPAGEAPATDGDVLGGRLTLQAQHHCKGRDRDRAGPAGTLESCSTGGGLSPLWGQSTHPCARCSPASTCPGGPGRSPRRRCPRGRCPSAAGACRCSPGTACCRRTWPSAPSSGWGLWGGTAM